MLQIHKPLSRKLWIYSTIALIGVGGPALVYGTSITPEYAKAAGTTLQDITTMQEMTPSICANSAIGEENLRVEDSRDGSTYSIKKLNNEQCWMIQNLRLTKESMATKGTILTNENSDITGTPVFTSLPASSESGFSNNTASNIYYDGNNTTYGAYYTWCAATAGTCSSATTAGVNATASICPKGWKLPVGGTGTTGTNTGATSDTKNDFMVMAGKTSTGNFTDASLVSGTNITLGTTTWPFAGSYRNSSPSSVGTDGYFWSRTVYSSTGAYRLYVANNGYVNPANYANRLNGFSVRCVAYADSTVGGSKVNVSVTPMITIDATSGMNSEVEASTVATGNITARISSNTAYKVLLSASTSNPGNKTSLYRRTDDMKEGTTPTYDTTGENIPATSTVEANKNGWGISNSCNQDGSNLAYLPITTVEKEYCGSSKEGAIYDSTTEQYTHTFGIGISVSPSLGSGTYETSITVTGVAN